MNQVFKPQDFRLLRRPCKRYQPERQAIESREQHTPGQVLTERQAPYSQGAHGQTIGVGCYRTLPRLRG